MKYMQMRKCQQTAKKFSNFKESMTNTFSYAPNKNATIVAKCKIWGELT